MNKPDVNATTRTSDTFLELARAALNGVSDREAIEALAALFLEHTGASPARLAALASEVRAVGR